MRQVKKNFSSRLIKRLIPLLLITLVVGFSFAQCQSWEPEEYYEPEEQHEPSETPRWSGYNPFPLFAYEMVPDFGPPVVKEQKWTGPRNPLTGLPTEEDISHYRPIAIVINNVRESMPQVGISQADIIYEVLVEGGITRMLAIFQDVSDVGRIGTVRSARAYTVDIAQSYDAIFVFAGGSPQAYAAVRNRGINHLDDITGRGSGAFVRDNSRRAPNNLFTSGAGLARTIPNMNFRTELPEGYIRALSFVEDGTPADGDVAMDFTVQFGTGSKTTSFTFNEETRRYYLRQYGAAYVDAGNNQQVAVTNVLILKMATSGIAGDTAGRLQITTTGTGTGYFVNGGYVIPINWSRDGVGGQFRYTTLDGQELMLGMGRTYICIIRPNMTVEFN